MTTKAQRIQAVLDGIPDDVGKLPPDPIDADELAAKTASVAVFGDHHKVKNAVMTISADYDERGDEMTDQTTPEIHEDGAVLHGSTWIHPSDYLDDDLEHGRLVALKGATLPGTLELQPSSIHYTTEPQ
jgi:hypothetical protein